MLDRRKQSLHTSIQQVGRKAASQCTSGMFMGNLYLYPRNRRNCRDARGDGHERYCISARWTVVYFSDPYSFAYDLVVGNAKITQAHAINWSPIGQSIGCPFAKPLYSARLNRPLPFVSDERFGCLILFSKPIHACDYI